MPQLNPMDWFFFSFIPLIFYVIPMSNMFFNQKESKNILKYCSMSWNW